MTKLGWMFMLFSWTAIMALAVFCFTKVFKKKNVD